MAPVFFLQGLKMSMLEAVVVFFLFFLPFQFAIHPLAGVDLAIVRVFALGIFFCFAVRSLSLKRIDLPPPLPLFFFTAFLLLSSCSFLWAENMEWTFRKAAFLLSFFPLFFVFFSLSSNPNREERAFRALVIGAVMVAGFSLLLFFSQFPLGVAPVFAFWVQDVLPFFLGPTFGEAVARYPSLLVNISGNTVMRVSGFFPDPHIASFFFGMAFPPALFFAWSSVGRFRPFWVIGAALILLADLLTFSRGGYIGLFFGGSAFLLPLLFRYGVWKKQAVNIALAAIITGTLLLASPIGTRFFSSFSQSDGSNIERMRLWKEAGASITSHPLLGVGLGNYPLAVKPSAVYREPIYAHNLFLDIAVETGLLGVFLFFSVLFFCILSLWRRWREESSPFSLALFSSLILFSAHAMFESPLFSVHILPILLLLMASSLVSIRRQPPTVDSSA